MEPVFFFIEPLPVKGAIQSTTQVGKVSVTLGMYSGIVMNKMPYNFV